MPTSAARCGSGKAWWFYSYRLDDQYKNVLGIDTLARSKLTNDYTIKGTFQLNQSNQIIGFINKRNKLQELRGLGPTTPVSAAQYQASSNYPSKVEWTSVLNNRMFLDVLIGTWRNFFPLKPTDEVGLYDGPVDARPHRPGQQPAHRLQRRLPGPEALEAAGLRVDELLQGRLEGLATTSSSATTGSAIAATSTRAQPLDIFYRDQGGVAEPGGHLQHADVAGERRPLQLRLDQRHLEDHAAPDA